MGVYEKGIFGVAFGFSLLVGGRATPEDRNARPTRAFFLSLVEREEKFQLLISFASVEGFCKFFLVQYLVMMLSIVCMKKNRKI